MATDDTLCERNLERLKARIRWHEHTIVGMAEELLRLREEHESTMADYFEEQDKVEELEAELAHVHKALEEAEAALHSSRLSAKQWHDLFIEASNRNTPPTDDDIKRLAKAMTTELEFRPIPPDLAEKINAANAEPAPSLFKVDVRGFGMAPEELPF